MSFFKNTIAKKARTIVLSNLNALLDATIDLNSIGAVKQHIRDLEAAEDKLNESVAAAKAHVVMLTQQNDKLTRQIKTTNDNLDLILGDDDPSNDHLAEPLEKELMGYEDKQKTLATELTTAKTTHQGLEQASKRLAGKHTEMMSALQKLEALDRSAKAKEQAADALKAAGAAGSLADGASVDDVTQRLEERAAVADAKFEQQMGGFNDSVGESIEDIKAKQRLAERRKQIEAKKAAAAAAAGSSE